MPFLELLRLYKTYHLEKYYQTNNFEDMFYYYFQ